MTDDIEFSNPEVELPSGERLRAARELLTRRLHAIRGAVDRDLPPADEVFRPTREESRAYLFEEACELYLNELGWEALTEEERIGDGELTEMVFPGLLAFVDALLPRTGRAARDRARQHRDVAHDFLLWLSARLLELREENGGRAHEAMRARREAAITSELIDLVAYRFFGLSSEEIERAAVR